MAIEISQVCPIFRIFDVAKAKEFYVDYLGFKIDWEHRFDEKSPLYMQVSHTGFTLHLSEHHADAAPGAKVFVRVRNLDEFHAELTAKNYGYLRPGIEKTFHQSISMEVIDPFYNRIIFDQSL